MERSCSFSPQRILHGDRYDLSLVGTTFDVASSPFAALVSIAKSRPLAVSELAASNICSCFCRPVMSPRFHALRDWDAPGGVHLGPQKLLLLVRRSFMAFGSRSKNASSCLATRRRGSRDRWLVECVSLGALIVCIENQAAARPVNASSCRPDGSFAHRESPQRVLKSRYGFVSDS